MKLKYFVVVAGLVGISSFAMADELGFYVGGKLGASILQSKDLNSHGHAKSGTGTTDYSRTDNKNKTVFNLGINVGYDFNALYGVPVRAELDYMHRFDAKINTSTYLYSDDGQGAAGGGTDDDKFIIKQSSLMLNGYYDFYNSSDFTPYVGAGLGMSFVKYKGDTGEDDTSFSKTRFAWALMAGVSYDIMDNVTANIEYRYLDSGKIKTTESDENFVDNISAKLHTHDINIGLRYSF